MYAICKPPENDVPVQVDDGVVPAVLTITYPPYASNFTHYRRVPR
jgi:hypothetical protein